MRKLIAGLFISLDGVVEADDPWHLRYLDNEFNEMIARQAAQCDAILLGRRTYLDFAALWPQQSGVVPVADFMNKTPKYVASSTLKTLEWENSRLLNSNVYDAVTKLKAQPGKSILIPGSPRLVWSLLCDGLVDELSLMILPIVVGSGMRLFDDVADNMRLKIRESKILSTSALFVAYERASA